MAEKGILAMLGARPPDEDEGGEDSGGDGSPEARAIADMFEAHERGDDEAAGKAFKRAYRICAASKGTESKAPEADEDTEDEY